VRVQHLPPPSNCASPYTIELFGLGREAFGVFGQRNRDDKDHRSACTVSSQGQGCGEERTKTTLGPSFPGVFGWTVRACVYRVRLFGSQYVGWSDLGK
jgi:hypothetical protein